MCLEEPVIWILFLCLTESLTILNATRPGGTVAFSTKEVSMQLSNSLFKITRKNTYPR